MPKDELEKINVRIFKSDLEFLTETYNPDGKGVGYNEIIRSIVRAHCKKMREQIAMKQGTKNESGN